MQFVLLARACFFHMCNVYMMYRLESEDCRYIPHKLLNYFGDVSLGMYLRRFTVRLC